MLESHSFALEAFHFFENRQFDFMFELSSQILVLVVLARQALVHRDHYKFPNERQRVRNLVLYLSIGLDSSRQRAH